MLTFKDKSHKSNLMTNTVSFEIHAINMNDEQCRQTLLEALAGDKEILFQQLDGVKLPGETLLKALNAFNNEDESSELSLDELEQLNGGVGLPEALVSSTILMTMVAGASGLFTSGMTASGQSSIQDALNAGIRADIESIRHDLSTHNLDEATGTYRPNAENGGIGQDFINALELEDIDGMPGTQTQENFGGEDVIRTIEAHGNSITVTYSHSGQQIQTTSMVSPASGWLS